MTFRSILCPVDFSEYSREALRYADDIARRTGGVLSVVYVNDPALFLAAAAAVHRRPHSLRRTLTELERFVDASIGAERRPACSVLEGNPAAEILNAARRLKSDLIVMGTHGLKGFDKLFFGSTTDQVLRRVTVPLLAVPPSNRSTKPQPSRRGHVPAIARVLVPLDLDGEWKHELNGAADVARVFGAELFLVHIVPRTHAPPWLRENVAAYDRTRLARARQALERVRAEVPSDIRTTSRAAVGNPADEIAAVAAKGRPSLVVMALRGGLQARHGSTTHHVLTRAVAPVMVLPR
jgi:nucleotide-binding universal stress UspA family protein